MSVHTRNQTKEKAAQVPLSEYVRQSVRIFRVRSVTLSFFGGFQNYVAEMFATIRQCVARKIHVGSSKVKVTLRGQRSKKGSNFRVRSVTLSFFGGFQNYLAEMFATIRRCVAARSWSVAQRSRSHLKVEGQKRGLIFVSAL